MKYFIVLLIKNAFVEIGHNLWSMLSPLGEEGVEVGVVDYEVLYVTSLTQVY